MSPDAFNPQPQGPASLPAMPLQPGNPLTPVQPSSPVAPAPAGGQPPMDAVVQAEQLVARYGTDPYQLAEAFGQLKSAHLLHYYHITTNPAGN